MRQTTAVRHTSIHKNSKKIWFTRCQRESYLLLYTFTCELHTLGQPAVVFMMLTPYVYLGRLKTQLQAYLNSKMPNKGIPMDFPLVYGTLNENQLLRAQQNQRGRYRYTVYCHSIPLSRKNTMPLLKIAKGMPVDLPPARTYVQRKSAVVGTKRGILM